MKLTTAIKKIVRNGMIAGVLAAAFIGAGLFVSSTASAQGDCDANAVIYCGGSTTQLIKDRYNNGTSHTTAKSTQDIYSSFGISSSDISTLGTTAVQGKVTKTGNVYIGDETTPVATDAMTAGRQNLAGSTKVVKNGTTFYKRTPDVSFTDTSLDAFVVMKNGVFQFAIIENCGNPVTGTPKTPDYTVSKSVAVQGSLDFKNDVTAQSGTHVIYAISVKSTGQVAARNVLVHDKLPANVQYVNNTLKRDGALVSADTKFFTSDGNTLTTINAGDTVTFTFEAIIGSTDTPGKCSAEVLRNEADISVPGLPDKSNNADVHKTCTPPPPPPTPTYTCDQLTSMAASRTQYNYTAKASAANGATITGYSFDFGDGTTATSATSTTTHTYSNPGDYTTVVNVVVQANNATQNVTSPACSTKVTVGQPPVAECTAFKLDITSGRVATATASYTPGATLTSASYDFGDGTAPVVNSTTTATHTYAADGTYTVKALLTFTVEGKPVTSNCQAPVTFLPTPIYSCDTFTLSASTNRFVTASDFKTTATNGATYKNAVINWGDNTVPVTADTVIGQTHTFASDGTYTVTVTPHFMVNGIELTATSPACSKSVTFSPTPTPPTPVTPQPPTTPTTLVNTGAGSVIGLFAAVTIGGTLLYRAMLRRYLGR